jgi:uncharacterized peroxidase-related enzyme
MPEVTPIDPATATGEIRNIFDGVQKLMGRVPAMLRLMAHSAAACDAYVHFNRAMSTANLNAQTRTLIAVRVAELNDCAYSRLIARGQAANSSVPERAIRAAVHGYSEEADTLQALMFAERLVTQRGRVGHADIEALRGVGFNDANIVELVATVSLSLFRNYFNLAIGTDADAPRAESA